MRKLNNQFFGLEKQFDVQGEESEDAVNPVVGDYQNDAKNAQQNGE